MDELRELDRQVTSALCRLTDQMILPIRPYSTDISAAWELVERIKGYIEVREYSYGYSEVDWYDSEADEHYFGRGKETPEAICRAFLAAMSTP